MTLFNNNVSTTRVSSEGDIQRYITYTGCNIALGEHSYLSVLSDSQFNNCTFSEFTSSVNNSNFINCGVISVTSEAITQKALDAQGNYWGDVNTEELKNKEITGDKNLSFIKDYYDGDFDLSMVDYSGYKDSPIADKGYKEGRGREEKDSKVYNIGERGPAGGFVFYDKGFYSDGWRYLEAAPSDIGAFTFGYYRPDGLNNNCVGTLQAIGAGRYNTERLVKCMNLEGDKAYSNGSGNETAEYAAKKCIDYIYGGYDDWFLPSNDELKLIYLNLQKNGLCSFDNNGYWSSSEYYRDAAWITGFGEGESDTKGRDSDYWSVLAVRAF